MEFTAIAQALEAFDDQAAMRVTHGASTYVVLTEASYNALYAASDRMDWELRQPREFLPLFDFTPTEEL